ncbi:MAG: hypothetical protein J7K13_05505 [Thermoplasmata archaeon]|nr:hypothetical protein [Thermoplasmata archaeon]
MVRFRWLRKRFKEISESTSVEKALLILPFFILFLDSYLLVHALTLNDFYIIIPVIVLFIFSTAEIVVAIDEIHERTLENRQKKRLLSKVRKTIEKTEEKPTVKQVMGLLLETYPELKNQRRQLYHAVCQVLSEKK